LETDGTNRETVNGRNKVSNYNQKRRSSDEKGNYSPSICLLEITVDELLERRNLITFGRRRKKEKLYYEDTQHTV
jgi:hypothetical protein